MVGVTQISLTLTEEGSIAIAESLFSGVVVSAGQGFLNSRGPIALYEVFLKHLDNEIALHPKS